MTLVCMVHSAVWSLIQAFHMFTHVDGCAVSRAPNLHDTPKMCSPACLSWMWHLSIWHHNEQPLLHQALLPAPSQPQYHSTCHNIKSIILVRHADFSEFTERTRGQTGCLSFDDCQSPQMLYAPKMSRIDLPFIFCQSTTEWVWRVCACKFRGARACKSGNLDLLQAFWPFLVFWFWNFPSTRGTFHLLHSNTLCTSWTRNSVQNGHSSNHTTLSINCLGLDCWLWNIRHTVAKMLKYSLSSTLWLNQYKSRGTILWWSLDNSNHQKFCLECEKKLGKFDLEQTDK